MAVEFLTEHNTSEGMDITPNTVKRHICPGPIVIAAPWDWFIRADFTRDQQINVGDAIASLSKLFSGGPDAIPENAADANADGAHDLGDVIYTLSYLFAGGQTPAAPFEQVGPDPEAEEPNIFTTEEFFTYFGLNARFGQTQSDLSFDLEFE